MTVTDKQGLRARDRVVINVTGPNGPPTACTAEALAAFPGGPVQLDSSCSSAPDGIASILWTQVAGEPVAILDATAPVSSFTAPVSSQLLEFRLIVTARSGLMSMRDLSVEVK